MAAPSGIRRALALAAASLMLAGCPEDDETTPPFTQADLAGEWRYTIFFTGPGVATGETGWVRGTSAIDGAGAATVRTYEDSAGATTVPALPPITYAISADGVVSATTTAFTQTYGKMNPAKTLFVTTATQGDRMRLAFYQRVVPGTSYSDADAASATFSLHQLLSGAAPGWLHGRVVVGADGVYSLAGATSPAGGPFDVPDQGTLSVSPSGVVTVDFDASFAGFLSADKGLVVGTQTTGSTHQLTVLFRSGGAYAQADLAGPWTYVNLAGSVGLAGWSRGAVAFDGAGVGTFQSQLTSGGARDVPAPITLAVAAGGTVTQTAPSPSAFHGALSPAKDVMVATDTHDEAAGIYGMIVAIR